MAGLELDAEVRHDLDQLVAKGVAAIVSATEEMSRQLREEHLPREAPEGATGALSSNWRERERDPLTRIVFPGEDAWYAHIVARGRAGVEPDRARSLTIGGEHRAWAGPAAPNPFDERAVAALEVGADQLHIDALSAQGVS